VLASSRPLSTLSADTHHGNEGRSQYRVSRKRQYILPL
jgi:hypothetical protein